MFIFTFKLTLLAYDNDFILVICSERIWSREIDHLLLLVILKWALCKLVGRTRSLSVSSLFLGGPSSKETTLLACSIFLVASSIALDAASIARASRSVKPLWWAGRGVGGRVSSFTEDKSQVNMLQDQQNCADQKWTYFNIGTLLF